MLAALQKPGFRGAYEAAAPFPHGVIENAFDPKALEAVRAELETLDFTDKETDLYRFSQSPDLSTIDATAAPALAKLRDALYSEKTRAAWSEALGCGPLSDKVDMAGAVYSSGSHLLVHDDVIGTRRVSFIVYLTRPEDQWCEEDGGCLELFDSSVGASGAREPAMAPAKRVVPTFNSVAFFTVVPGVSFHAVQEVLAVEKHRISIQGWYHAPADANPAAAADSLSVRDLRKQASLGAFAPCAVPIPPPTKKRVKKATLEVPSIAAADLKELEGLGVHPMYLDPENVIVLADALKRQGVVRLAQFLLPPLVAHVEDAIRAEDEKDKLGLGSGVVPDPAAGVRGAWKPAGPAHVRRCLALHDEEPEAQSKKAHRAEQADADDMLPTLDATLRLMQENLVASDAFARFVAALVSTSCSGKLVGRRDTVHRYRPGLDYTLATVPSDATEIDVRLTFCALPPADDDEEDGAAAEASEDEEEGDEEEAGEEEEDADLWAGCDVGGFDSYIQAAEGDAAVVANDEDAVTNLPCQANCLTIAVRATDQMHFVKYVQAVAPSSRYDVGTTFRVAE